MISKEEIKYSIVHEKVPFYRNNFINNFNYYDGIEKFESNNINEIKSSILFSLMKDCLEKNPELRPNIDKLSEKYTLLIKSITA